MLSCENNTPDPPIKHIGKSTVHHNISVHENITGDNDLVEVEQDQLNSSSIEAAQNFSIRDFVLAARSKDIGTSWPFPEKHLKICLMHGVKDFLPPFLSKTSKRTQSCSTCLQKTTMIDDGIITRILNEGPLANVDSLTVSSLGDVALTKKITVDRLDANLYKSDKESEYPSSATSNSQSYPLRSRGTFKHHNFVKTSAKHSAKKCKLIVKFGIPSVHSSNDGSMPHKTNLTESPASNVCPVCKAFSSSSNTTLNAHIDQCLCMETASEGMVDSKIAMRCKVKMRKMRSMVDIYATALECTIEDLDRRNGSSWAADLNSRVMSAQVNKKQTMSPTEPDRENDDGGVYIDANGRKLRILSKIDISSTVVTTREDHGKSKPQISKILSSSKKKHHGAEHHKYLRLAISNNSYMAPEANSSKASRCEKFSKDVAHSQINGSLETDEPESLRAKDIQQRSGHKIRTDQRSKIKSRKLRLGSFGVEISSYRDFSGDSASLSGSSEKVMSTDDIRISMKPCLGVKRAELPMSKGDKSYKMDTNGHKRLRKSAECVNESTKSYDTDTNDHGWLRKSTECVNESIRVGKNSSWKPLKQLNGSEKDVDQNRLRSVKSADGIKRIHRFSHKSAISHKNDTSSPSKLSVHEQIWKNTVCLTNEEDRVQIDVEEEDELEDANSDEDHVMHGAVPEDTKKYRVTNGITLNESEQDRRSVRRLSEEGSRNVSVNTCDKLVDHLGVPSSSGTVVEQETLDIQTNTCMNLTAERTMRSFIRSMNPGIHKTADFYDYQSTSSKPSKGSFTGPSSAPSPPVSVLDNGTCNYSITKSESDAAHVDPIPIPGPPGSFLPSPGNAETEECYQRNSSLTASVISSHEQGDGNSVDSPNSNTSSVSNLAAETSEKVAENPGSSPSGFPILSSELSLDKAPVFPYSMKVGASRIEYGQRKSTLKPLDENHSCCCSRRERVSRGSIDDYQESQLLIRRTMPAVVLPTKKNISCSLNSAPSYSRAGPDIYSLSSSSSVQVEAIPVLGTPVGFASPKYLDTKNASKFDTNIDYESASPSAVLRLMGKNLMVAKIDENLSGSLGDAAPSDANSQMFSRKAASPRNSYYSQRAGPPDPATMSPSYNSMRRSLEFIAPNGPWQHINFTRPDFSNPSQEMFTGSHDMHINQGVPGPLDHKQQQCMPYDQMHRSISGATDFGQHVITSENEAGALKSETTVFKGTGVSVVAEHDQSRLVLDQGTQQLAYPIYPSFPPSLSPTPIHMQQGPRNTCFPVPSSGPFCESASNDLHAKWDIYTAGSLIHPKPELLYSTRQP